MSAACDSFREGSVGLLGGAFDPPHLGHLTVAREGLRQLELRSLLVVVTGDAPHKVVRTDAEVRVSLAQLAFAGLDAVEVSRVELDRPGPSYTLDTVRWARQRYGNPVFLIGADEFADFLEWHEPDGVLEAARLAVATRPGYARAQLDVVLEALARPERVELFSIPETPISSSEIRRRVAAGLAIDHLVPAPVASEIRKRGLYRDADAGQRVPSSGMDPTCEGP